MHPQSLSQSARSGRAKPQSWRLHVLLIILCWLLTLWLWLIPRDPNTVVLCAGTTSSVLNGSKHRFYRQSYDVTLPWVASWY